MKKKSVTKQSINALNDFKAAQELENHNKLVEAINRLSANQPKILKRGTKLNATNVALEAGVSRGTVYKHKDIIDKINTILENPHKSEYQIKKAQEAKRIEVEKRNKSILDQLTIDKANLAQENYRLNLELNEARTKLDNLIKEKNSRKVANIDANRMQIK